MRLLLAALLCALPVTAQAAQPCTGPACCVVYGVEAVCRSAVVEARARAIVLRRCPGCKPSAVTDWIYTFQMTEGPYESSKELAHDVYCAIKGCSYP